MSSLSLSFPLDLSLVAFFLTTCLCISHLGQPQRLPHRDVRLR
jgi:hypothetical protein